MLHRKHARTLFDVRACFLSCFRGTVVAGKATASHHLGIFGNKARGGGRGGWGERDPPPRKQGGPLSPKFSY